MNVALDPVEHAAPTTRTATPAAAAEAGVRYDIYRPIHKALRAFFCDTLVRIGRMDPLDAADRDEALAQLDALLELCESHVRHENGHVHTAIEARVPAGSARIAGEHVEHLEAIAALRVDAAALVEAGGAAQADRIQHRLYRHLALFVAENFEHMNVEETAHNALLWQHYGDAEILAIDLRLRATVEPPTMMRVLHWMLPALPPVERAALAGELRAGLPPPVFQELLAGWQARLDARGWRRLAESLGGNPATPL